MKYVIFARLCSTSSIGIRTMSFSTPVIYKSVDSILEFLKKPENFPRPGVAQLLEIYENAKQKSESVTDAKKHRLVVLEGLDGCGKSTIGKRAAKKTNAIQMKTPPNSVDHLRKLFDASKDLRTAFYSLGNYIAAFEVSCVLPKRPVVMDRFWHSTAAYALSQAIVDHPDEFQVLPSTGDAMYRWPDDLLKPDVVLFLNVNENVRLDRHSRRQIVTDQEGLLKDDAVFRENVIAAYKNMREPGVEIVDGNQSFGKVLWFVSNKIQMLDGN